MWYTHSHCVYLNICYIQLFYVYQHTTNYADYWVFNSINHSCLLDVKLHIFHVYRGREHVQQYIQKDDSEMRLPRFWNETTKTTTLYCLWKSINSIGTIKKASWWDFDTLMFLLAICNVSGDFHSSYTPSKMVYGSAFRILNSQTINLVGIPFQLHVDVLRSSGS